MFLDPKPKSELQKAIDEATAKMRMLDPTSDEYATIMERVSKLHKLKEIESPKRVSPDTLLTVGANLVGIWMIIHHEQLNVIASKALPFVKKA